MMVRRAMCVGARGALLRDESEAVLRVRAVQPQAVVDRRVGDAQNARQVAAKQWAKIGKIVIMFTDPLSSCCSVPNTWLVSVLERLLHARHAVGALRPTSLAAKRSTPHEKMCNRLGSSGSSMDSTMVSAASVELSLFVASVLS